MKNAKETIKQYEEFLRLEEKSAGTIKKYTVLAKDFLTFAGQKTITKELTLAYKEKLKEASVPTGVNVKLSALNGFLRFLGKPECCVKTLRIQQELFCAPEKELQAEDGRRLLEAAEGTKFFYIIQCFCETGIRVSELPYITVEAVMCGHVRVHCKNKFREIFLSEPLCEALKEYVKKQGICEGSIFVTRTGRPMERTCIWKGLKKLCGKACVDPQKVFPHNFRHLFARIFHSLEKDLAKLADLLGHSSLQTTRGYIKESGAEHRKGLERIWQKIREQQNNDSVALFTHKFNDPLSY